MREAFVKAQPEQRQAMQQMLDDLFRDITVDRPVFLTQEEEGKSEFIGTDSMYTMLSENKIIPASRLVGSWGMGRGSSQLYFTNGFVTVPVNYPAGMNDLEKLRRLPECLKEQLSKNADQFRRIFTSASDENCTIALKSGCAITLQKNANVRALFFGPESM
jgi:hypothetical protein